MDISTLECFITVARLEHITKAAQQLNMTQPALTRTIHHLEQEVDCPLFDRSKNRIVLNDNGRILLQASEDILSIWNQARADLIRQRQENETRITIAVRSASILLTQPITEFRGLYPQAHFQLDDETLGIFPEQADFLLRSSSALTPQDDSFLLAEQEMFAVVNSRHRLAGRGGIRLAELAGEDFILLSQRNDSYSIVLEYCAHAGFRPKIMALTEKSLSLYKFLMENAGVSIMPHSELFESLHFLPITDITCRRRIYLIPNERRPQSKLCQAFWEYIRNIYRQSR